VVEVSLNTTKWHNFDNARVSRIEISLRFSFNILNKMSCFTPLYCKKMSTVTENKFRWFDII